MASVTPGYTFTGVSDPITATKLNLLGQPTVAIGNGEITAINLAAGSVTADKIDTSAVTASKVATDAVGTTAIVNAAVTTAKLAANLTISGLTISANTPFQGSATTESFSGTITITCDNLHGNTRIVNCTSNTSSTLNASAILPAGTHLNIIFTTDGTASNTITFGTNFKKTGTYALNSTNKWYVAMFISDGTYWVEASRAGPSS